MRSVLYITRNGLLEPLGQSQVFSYLKGLSEHYRVSLVTFEKPSDIKDKYELDRIHAECFKHGIQWYPQRFYFRPKLIAPLWCMAVMFFMCMREVCKGNSGLIHARSYIPAGVALLVNKLTGTPFIFDMRALWPEELITAGKIKRDGFFHRVLVWLERACLKNAAKTVCLTDASVEYLRGVYPRDFDLRRVSVIPTCADLDRFSPAEDKNPETVYSCLGTVLSGWFLIERLALFFHYVFEKDPESRFEVITLDDPDIVRKKMGGTSDFQQRLNVFGVSPRNVPDYVKGHTASIMFYAGGSVSELGRSPTRMAEILGCGLPVVANSGVGDVARIIERYNVGVLVESDSIEDLACAFDELARLRLDPGLEKRCRDAAVEVFSLESGTKRYKELYQSILTN